MKVALLSERAEVLFDNSVVTGDKLATTVNGMGYQASVTTTQRVNRDGSFESGNGPEVSAEDMAQVRSTAPHPRRPARACLSLLPMGRRAYAIV